MGTIPPHSTICAQVKADTIVYNSHFNVDVCINGGFRCQYSKPCTNPQWGDHTGHYFWYGYFDNTAHTGIGKACFTMKGKGGASVDSNSKTSTSPGHCKNMAENTTEALV